MSSIVLIGFMGAGKTTVGKELVKKGFELIEENRKLLKELGMVVYLRIKPETVLARLKGDTTRPLLKGDDSGERVRTLMQQRESHYLSGADFVLDVDQKTPEELAEEIFKEF